MATTRLRVSAFIGLGLVAALLLAGVVSFYASANPDGLERVATDKGFLGSARDSATAGSPLADYGVSGLDNERLAVGLAGIIGVVLVFAVAALLFKLVARRPSSTDPTSSGGGRRA